MPSEIFKRADVRYLAQALSVDATHAAISTFELGLDMPRNTAADGANKGVRANQILEHIFRRGNTDELVVSLLNFLYVENSYANTSDQNTVYRLLREKVLDPRGVVLTDDGFQLPDGRGIDELRAEDSSTVQSEEPDFLIASEGRPATSFRPRPPADEAQDRSRVFVVHGRDLRPVNVIRQFLHYIGLNMMSWEEAVALTGETQPHTYDVVYAGMSHAAAVIVIFSPDDLARVKDEFSTSDDPDRSPQGQTRQNVLLEAGMAFAMARGRTIFVRSDRVREISDIAGFNWVSLDGRWGSRSDLKGRLTTAGAAVRAGEYDLMDPIAGPFKID